MEADILLVIIVLCIIILSTFVGALIAELLG